MALALPLVRSLDGAPVALAAPSVLGLAAGVPDPGIAPEIDGVLGAFPLLPGLTFLHDFELGRNLDIVAVGVLDHEKEVVAGPMPARPPPDRNFQRCEVVGP